MLPLTPAPPRTCNAPLVVLVVAVVLLITKLFVFARIRANSFAVAMPPSE